MPSSLLLQCLARDRDGKRCDRERGHAARHYRVVSITHTRDADTGSMRSEAHWRSWGARDGARRA